MTLTIILYILGLALTVAVILVARKAIKKHNKENAPTCMAQTGASASMKAPTP